MKTNGFVNSVKTFLAATLLYCCAIAVVTLISTLGVTPFGTHDPLSGIVCSAVLNSLAGAEMVGLIIFVVFLIINIFSHKAATIATAVIYSLLTVGDIGLNIYFSHNSTLLGNEMIIRPFRETVMAVQGAMGILIPILLIGVLTALLVFVMLRIVRRPIRKGIIITQCSLLALGIFLTIFPLRPAHHENRNLVTSKSWYFVTDCYRYFSSNISSKSATDNSFNEELIDRFVANRRQVIPDKNYPLEHIADSSSDALCGYFAESNQKPSIYIILVESLGEEFMPHFAPFVDSLAQTGLYWNHCLSTTTRSFGAIPAITGSLVGPKSFQFGTMPDHNSLISVLNDNDYRTNAFYGGDFTFDCIYEFLNAEQTDYLSPYWQELKAHPDKTVSTWWGYNDSVLFAKTFNDISQNENQPQFNLIVTLTTHENLKLANAERQAHYINMANTIVNRTDSNKDLVSRYAAMFYTDDCIHRFFESCKHLPDFSNSIFIITGDHTSQTANKSDIARLHNVPLVIWSPMLKQNRQFSDIVTHNDIEPSLTTLLKNNFGLRVPQTSHSISNGLTTDNSVSLQNPMPIIAYQREIIEFLCDTLYYTAEDHYLGENVFRLDSNLEMHKLNDQHLRDSLRTLLDLYRYIYYYTYHNNKVTQNCVQQKQVFENVFTQANARTILCQTPDRRPSEVGTNSYFLLEPTLISTEKDKSTVRVTLRTDIMLNSELEGIDYYMDLIFKCQGNYTTYYSGKIVKFIESEEIAANKVYKIQITKDFPIEKASENEISVCVETVVFDDQWIPKTTMKVMNTEIGIERSK